MKLPGESWTSAVYRRPHPLEVLKLVESHGAQAAEARWGYLGTRTLGQLLQRGKRIREKEARRK